MCSSDQSGAASVRDPAASQRWGFKEFGLQRWILWSRNYSLEIFGKRGDPEQQNLSLQPTRPENVNPPEKRSEIKTYAGMWQPHPNNYRF